MNSDNTNVNDQCWDGQWMRVKKLNLLLIHKFAAAVSEYQDKTLQHNNKLKQNCASVTT